MRLKFGSAIYSNDFYQVVLKLICDYINSSDDTCIIDMSKTEFIQPSVLCNLISALQWAKESGKPPIHFIIKQNRKLHEYLIQTRFYGFSIRTGRDDQLITTDQDTYVLDSHAPKKKIEKIVFATCESVSAVSNDKKKKQQITALQQKNYQALYNHIICIPQIRALFSNVKEHRVISMFSGLIENAWEHGKEEEWSQDCYYTFQIYKKSGFCFSVSDWGVGFFNSLARVYSQKTARKVEEGEEETIVSPRVLTLSEFFSLDSYYKDLAGIVEALCYRMYSVEFYGLSDLLKWYFYDIKGEKTYRKIRIHSGFVLILVDIQFLTRYFRVDNEGRILDFNRDALRHLILTKRALESEIKQGTISIFPYYFPGVHIDASLSNSQYEGN